MPASLFPLLAAAALVIEAAAGYPESLYRVIGHPVTWIGALITALESRLNRGASLRRRLAGIATLALILAAAGLPTLVLQYLLGGSKLGFLLLAVLAASLPAQRSLYVHVKAVADALDSGGLDAGRTPFHRSSAAIRSRSMRPASRAPRLKASPRISPTASSRRCSGSRLSACPAAPPTRPSTPPIP